MKKFLCTVVFLLIPVFAYGAELKAGGHESLSPGDSATGITATVKNPTSGEFKNKSARAALISVEDNSARFAIDGTTPTNASGDSSDTGHKIDSGQSYYLGNPVAVNNFRIIDHTSGSASVIKVTVFFK